MHIITNFFQLYYITKSYINQNCITKNYIINILQSKAIYKLIYFCYNKIYKIECIVRNYIKKISQLEVM